MLLHPAEINTLLSDLSEYGHGGPLKLKDFSDYLPVQSHFHAPLPHSLNISDSFALKDFELEQLPQGSMSHDLQHLSAGCRCSRA